MKGEHGELVKYIRENLCFVQCKNEMSNFYISLNMQSLRNYNIFFLEDTCTFRRRQSRLTFCDMIFLLLFNVFGQVANILTYNTLQVINKTCVVKNYHDK